MTAPEVERMNAIRAALAAHTTDDDERRNHNRVRNTFKLGRTTLRGGQSLEWRDTVARALVLELLPEVAPATFAAALERATEIADGVTDEQP